MATTVFDFAAEQLERRTDLDRLEARGTLRLALKSAGLDPREVTAGQMAVVVGHVLEAELRTRGVDEPAAICQALLGDLKRLDPNQSAEPAPDSPEAIFRRLARG